MIDPLFWLGLSLLLVAASLTAVLVAALPALQELSRAARSAEKLFDTLNRELPPTLEAIRLTGLEISDLTDDVSEGVQSAAQVAKQVDRGLDNAVKQAQKIEVSTRSIYAGVKAAWKTLLNPAVNHRYRERWSGTPRRVKMRDRNINSDPEAVAAWEQHRKYNVNAESAADLDPDNWYDPAEFDAEESS